MESPLRVIAHDLDESALRLTASLQNDSPLPLSETIVTALLYNAEGTLVNASQTKIASFAGREQRGVVFTWQEPFSSPVVRVEIIPRLAVP